ncbi:hypothetical protein TWF718_010475 [Orbilia javanica]|uniref:Uncharacterized protein n=1 Tax=Orbilia javanica TaxID=47235 RepID=A0AAN8MS23_9PEZI
MFTALETTMAAVGPYSRVFDPEYPLPPNIMIEEALQQNPFMAAAVGQAFIQEHPATWENIPRIATTAFTVPISPSTQGVYRTGYSRFGEPKNRTFRPSSDSTASYLDYSTSSPVEIVPPRAQSEYHIREDSSTYPSSTQSYENSIPQQRLPKGFTSHCSSSNLDADILQHNGSDSKILFTPNGEMRPLYKAQKQSYFGTHHPFPPPIIYYDPVHGSPVHVVSYSQPQLAHCLPPFNPVEGTTNRMPVFKDEIIPTFDMGYYPDILHLPSRPSDVLVYFNSICAAAALSGNRKDWIEDNLRETEVIFCSLDDAIFQMCEAYSGKPLRGPNDEPGQSFVIEGFKVTPCSTLFFDWELEIRECQIHLERLNKLAYVPVMNKSKVDVVWQALVAYRDNWANYLFSNCQEDYWEASEEELEAMKEYHKFNREIQRVYKGIEDDLINVRRLENMVTAFRGAVWKAETKFQRLKEKFGPTVD